MGQKQYSSDLTEQQWAKIASYFIVRRTSKWPLLAIVNGILYVLKNGCGWRDVPGDFPPWPTVHYYFAKWSRDGTWQRVSAHLTITAREREKKRPSRLRRSSTAKA